MEEFDYDIVYKKGSLNANADALSRVKIECIIKISLLRKHPHKNHLIFNIQLIFKKPDRRPPNQIINLFRNKQRRIIQLPDFTEENLVSIFKQYLPSNKLSAIYTDEETFKVIQCIYSENFSNSKTFKIVTCKEILKDIIENDEQDKIISDYHNNKNHRAINETTMHLKREYYFPFMKEKIKRIINNCQIWQTMKYDSSLFVIVSV